MTQTLPADVVLPDDRFVEVAARLWIASLRGMADHIEGYVDAEGGIDGLTAAIAAGARGVPLSKLIADAMAMETADAMRATPPAAQVLAA